MDSNSKINKKLIILTFHNIACIFQKLKDFESCILYLDAVIYHYDGLLESKYNITINENCKINNFLYITITYNNFQLLTTITNNRSEKYINRRLFKKYKFRRNYTKA